MRVKIGDKVYDPNKEPIMLILTDTDKHNIGNMSPECNTYVIFPKHLNKDKVNEWTKRFNH